uniref:Cytoplasmic protein n=1 Tax=uncultured delta proteobacterium TaxID=34034 RepID=Q2YZS8_9DELT|nr:hypothetical protein [uncultured delta proteobacterium]
MNRYSHKFVEEYKEGLAFGFDREMDEKTIICYLQMFSDDQLMEKIIKSLSEKELEEIFNMISGILNKYLTESEYHALFLKDEH